MLSNTIFENQVPAIVSMSAVKESASVMIMYDLDAFAISLIMYLMFVVTSDNLCFFVFIMSSPALYVNFMIICRQKLLIMKIVQ